LIAVFVTYAHGLAGFSSIPQHTYVPLVPGTPATDTTPEVDAIPANVRALNPGETRVAIPDVPEHPVIEVFGTADENAILGQRVEPGRVIMLSGDTGISAYNHLHQHVQTHSSGSVSHKERKKPKGNAAYTFTIPYLYADLKHTVDNGFFKAGFKDGIPHAMTFYGSRNERNGP
jgi:hypothetical protein